MGNLADARERARATGGGAVMSEWRTPPLWGVADSAPYLHDGRASTLDVAIRQHGGEASKIAARYGKLERGDRRLLLQFLHSLTVVQPKSRRTAAIEAIQARGTADRHSAGMNRLEWKSGAIEVRIEVGAWLRPSPRVAPHDRVGVPTEPGMTRRVRE